MGFQAYLFDNDDRFFVGWRLSESWILCTVSWCVSILSAVFIGASALVLSPENGYEIIPGGHYDG